MATKENKEKKVVSALPVRGLAGLALLFVCVSVVYANYIVFFGTHDVVSKFMLIPSTLFVLCFLVYKAVK